MSSLALAALTSCGAFGSSSGPSRVQDVVGWMERVHVESEVAAQRVNAAVESLQGMMRGDFETDAVDAYAAFVAAVEASEEQWTTLDGVVQPLKKAAAPVFDQWGEDLEKMQNESLRARSEKRMEVTRRQYDAVVLALDPLLEAYRGFNATLRDHALFLAHDLNPGSLQSLQADVDALHRTAHELGFGFGSALTAAQSYIHGSSLPAGRDGAAQPAQPAAPAAPQGR